MGLLNTTGLSVIRQLSFLGRVHLAPHGMAMRARKRKVLRPDRAPVGKARSPPARSACFPHPVQRKARGRSVAKQEAPLGIYNDEQPDHVQLRCNLCQGEDTGRHVKD